MIESFKLPNITPETISGSICSFNDEYGNLPLKVCTSLISGYQEGSGIPSPSNVRPLHAWNGANLTACGTNLFDLSRFAIEYPSYCSISDGVLNVTSNSILYTNGVEVDIPADILDCYLVFEIKVGTATNPRIRVDFSDNTSGNYFPSSYEQEWNKTIVNLPNKRITAIKLNWSSVGTYSVRNFCIGFSSQNDGEFEPYNGNTYTFTFGQDIYQGYIDWKRGVVVGTWGYIASYNGETLTGEWLCDKAPYEAGTTPPTGSQVAYELATPIEIPLGGIQLLTQQGVNNIFCNTGNTEVKRLKVN